MAHPIPVYMQRMQKLFENHFRRHIYGVEWYSVDDRRSIDISSFHSTLYACMDGICCAYAFLRFFFFLQNNQFNARMFFLVRAVFDFIELITMHIYQDLYGF